MVNWHDHFGKPYCLYPSEEKFSIFTDAFMSRFEKEYPCKLFKSQGEIITTIENIIITNIEPSFILFNNTIRIVYNDEKLEIRLFAVGDISQKAYVIAYVERSILPLVVVGGGCSANTDRTHAYHKRSSSVI